MDKIRYCDIDFSKLKVLKESISRLYHNNKELYKIFSEKYSLDDKKMKCLKLKLLSSFAIPNVLDIDKLIYEISLCDAEIFLGYSRRYIIGKPLYDYLMINKDLSIFLKLVKEISLSLRNIHDDSRNIVIGDFHFGNILVEEFFDGLKHYFIDLEDCKIDNLKATSHPIMLINFAKERGLKVVISSNTDRLCLILNFLYVIFEHKNLYLISEYEYDEKAEQILTLKNMRDIFIYISKRRPFFPTVPYIDEIIDTKDTSKCLLQNTRL